MVRIFNKQYAVAIPYEIAENLTAEALIRMQVEIERIYDTREDEIRDALRLVVDDPQMEVQVTER